MIPPALRRAIRRQDREESQVLNTNTDSQIRST